MNSALEWYNEDVHTNSSHFRSLTQDESLLIAEVLSIIANEQPIQDTTLLFQLEALYSEIMDALLNKQGFIIVKGFPAAKDNPNLEHIKSFFIEFCRALGQPLQQNKNHDILFDVKSIEGIRLDSPDSRGPYVKDSLPMHTDAGAILGMYCLAAANVGGNTILASARAVHDEIQKTRPDLLEVLYQPFYTDRRGNELEGDLPYDVSPVFAMYGDELKCQYHQPFYDDAQTKFPQIPRYTPQQVEALQLFDKVALQKNIALEVKVEPGWLIFINNEAILHGRTSFDYVENQTVRHLLRIWLNTPRIKHTFPNFLGYKAETN